MATYLHGFLIVCVIPTPSKVNKEWLKNIFPSRSIKSENSRGLVKTKEEETLPVAITALYNHFCLSIWPPTHVVDDDLELPILLLLPPKSWDWATTYSLWDTKNQICGPMHIRQALYRLKPLLWFLLIPQEFDTIYFDDISTSTRSLTPPRSTPSSLAIPHVYVLLLFSLITPQLKILCSPHTGHPLERG